MADVQDKRAEITGKIQAFTCKSCSAKLSFKPGSTSLQCGYCGTLNEIVAAQEGVVEELDFDSWLRECEGRSEKVEQSTVKCSNCSAEQTLAANLVASHCSFCKSPISSPLYAQRTIKPRAVIPFKIDKNKAEAEFRRWLGTLWLAPGDLKKYATTDGALRGLYIPYWTYDSNTSTQYSGQRGVVRYESQRYQTQDSNGNNVSETRQVEKVDWYPASGYVERFHDDVLVLASSSFPAAMKAPIYGWNLSNLTPYQDEYVANFQVEAYQIGLAEGFRVAKPIIEGQVADAVRQDIGGDRQVITSMKVDYHDMTFKHLLMPLWMSSYRYRGKVFRFMINGQTGQVVGESPKSAWKIAGLIVGGIILVIIVLSFKK